MFTDDTSLFFVVHYIDTSANDLNYDLEKISEWDFQWKMKFNPDPTKQTCKKIFSRNKIASIHPIVYSVNSTATNKDLGMILDSKLSYEHHLQPVFSRVNKTIGLLRKLQFTLPRKSQITIYKLFIKPHSDYGYVVYDRVSNESFHQSLESF